MAYPFAPMPTLGGFVDRVTSFYEAEVMDIDGISGPRGKANVRSLVRTGKDGKKKIAVIPNLKDDEFLIPSALRSLCVQLDLPLKDFGFILG